MAVCKSCGYCIPYGAKKCAHCGADLDVRLLRRVWLNFWKSVVALTNLGAILASLATCVMAIVMIFQTRSMENQAILLEAQTQALNKQASSIEAQTNILQKNFELQYIPIVKIGAVAFNFIPYNDGTPNGSVAMYFTIPIENKHGFAENVKIVKKELTLLRGKFNPENAECMRSVLTLRPFELSSGQIKYDSIGIDENPSYFEEFRKGQAAFTLEYKIEYNAMPEVSKETYSYNYIIKFIGGKQEIITEDATPPHKEPKP